MNKPIQFILAGAAIALLSGCAMSPGGVSASSTPINGRTYTQLGPVQDTSTRVYLLGLLPISGENSIRKSIDSAVKSRAGDALINVTVDHYSQYWILWSSFTTRVEGDVIQFNPVEK